MFASLFFSAMCKAWHKQHLPGESSLPLRAVFRGPIRWVRSALMAANKVQLVYFKINYHLPPCPMTGRRLPTTTGVVIRPARSLD